MSLNNFKSVGPFILFEKISLPQFKKDMKSICCDGISDTNIEYIYDEIGLPCRHTSGSAGYDFKATYSFTLEPGESILIPTGVKAFFPAGVVLLIVPRSSLGFGYRLQLDNTVGVIDSDYYQANNEGHIMIKVTNDSKNGRTLEVERGDRIAQGIFVPCYFANGEDAPDDERTGGIGSTGR